jgi:antitoxin FitA
MGQLLVRGVDEELIRSLKERAARHGRSVEAEHRAILEDALNTERESFAELCARLRTAAPWPTADSTELIRADRDRNYDYDPDEFKRGGDRRVRGREVGGRGVPD